MRLSFVVLGLGLLSTLALVECEKTRMLILSDVSKTANPGYYFRSNSLYLPAGYQSVIKINCTLPDWYNATQPSTYNYEWKRPDGTLLNSDRGLLEIKTSSPNGVYTCEVKDKSKDSKPLTGWATTEMRVFRQSAQTRNKKPLYIAVWNDGDENHINYTSVDPKPMQHELVLTCTCDGCAEKSEKYYWLLDGKNVTYDGKRGINHNDSSLIIPHPFYYDVGIYTCLNEANNNTLAFTSITGVPVFAAKGGKGSDNKLEGETVTVSNELYGNPINRFQWKRSEDDDNFDKAEVVNVYDVDNKKEKVIEEFLSKNGGLLKRLKFYPTLDAPNGELEITELEKEDRATYIAEATGYGGQTATFANLVRVKGKLDALWPFLGIVAEVILLVAIIFIYERRRAKKEAELEENPEQKQPLKTNDNLRQRKA